MMIRILIAAALACALAGPARAQTTNAAKWPTRPVTMVVPFGAGGPVDLVGRIVAQHLSEKLGQQVIVENVGGGGGAIGAARIAKAAPDGSAFLFGNQGTHTFTQLISKKPLYNAVTDFAPVAVVVENQKLLITRPDFPANSLAEFISYAKANKAKLQFGSAGARLSHACNVRTDEHGDRPQYYACTISQHRRGNAGHHRRPYRLPLRRDLDQPASVAQPVGEGARLAFAPA